jgi:hypothetical protein
MEPHWQGDTLVVETRHFPHRVASLFMRARAYGSAENMVLTERFTRVDTGSQIQQEGG